MSDQNVNVKKVKAYPISAHLKMDTDVFPARIVKLTMQGFLAEVSTGLLKPGDSLEIGFETPVHHKTVSEHGKVVKIYNQWSGKHQHAHGDSAGPGEASAHPSGSHGGGSAATHAPAVIHLVEVHFLKLSGFGREHIAKFLEALAKAPKSG